MADSGLDGIARRVRSVPDFPKPGILFRDLTPVMADPDAFAASVRLLSECTERPQAVVGVESRGFIFGAGVALRWQVPFVPARKLGKLPGSTLREPYALEYGHDTLEIQTEALLPGHRVVLIDDLLATGGTARAVAALIERAGARLAAAVFVVELEGLGGRERLAPHPVHALLRMPAG